MNYQYKAFGLKDYAYKYRPQATGYIGKEKDKENNLGDHGLRKYDSQIGRFSSTEPLYEKYFGWSPYQYSFNNPVNFSDWNGLNPGALVAVPAYVGGAVTIAVIGWTYVELTNPWANQTLVNAIINSYEVAVNNLNEFLSSSNTNSIPANNTNVQDSTKVNNSQMIDSKYDEYVKSNAETKPLEASSSKNDRNIAKGAKDRINEQINNLRNDLKNSQNNKDKEKFKDKIKHLMKKTI